MLCKQNAPFMGSFLSHIWLKVLNVSKGLIWAEEAVAMEWSFLEFVVFWGRPFFSFPFLHCIPLTPSMAWYCGSKEALLMLAKVSLLAPLQVQEKAQVTAPGSCSQLQLDGELSSEYRRVLCLSENLACSWLLLPDLVEEGFSTVADYSFEI